MIRREQKHPLPVARQRVFVPIYSAAFTPVCLYAVFRGVGVQIFLRVGFSERKFSELEGLRTYCVSNKVPGHPLEIFDFGVGSGSYFLPSLIAACAE